MSRKTRKPPSLLAAIQAATAAFTGDARLVEDTPVPAGETSFRGPGYGLATEITPQRALFGTLPDAALRMQGETGRAPDARLSLDASRFPPDTLRRVPYWDCARSDALQPVLVVLAETALVRLLSGPDDDLPDTVVLIHRWTGLAEAEQRPVVLDDLGKPGHGPVAYVAAFELLMGTTYDLPGLYDAFMVFPSRPGAATQGIVDELYRVGTSLPGAEIMALAWRLLDGWAQESDPAALSSYLLWFDAHQQRTWSEDQKMRKAVLAEVERASALSFSGPDAVAWERQVRYYSSTLLRGAES